MPRPGQGRAPRPRPGDRQDALHQRGRDQGLPRRLLRLAPVRRLRPVRPGQAGRRVHRAGVAPAPSRREVQAGARHLRRRGGPLQPPAPQARHRGDQADDHRGPLPRLRGRAAQRRGARLADRRAQPRRLLRHGDQRPGRDAQGARQRRRRARDRGAEQDRGDRARLSQPRQGDQLAVGRRGAAAEDRAAPGLVAVGADLHLDEPSAGLHRATCTCSASCCSNCATRATR